MKISKIVALLSIVIIFYACEEGGYKFSLDQSTSTGTGGSLARFTISGDYLYTVDVNKLKTFSVSDEKNPALLAETYINEAVETIFAMDDLLFLGTEYGVYIYGISDPSAPKYVSSFSHVRSCDPVVVKGNYAYSTLNSAGPCGQGLNELDIIDISNPQDPVLERVLSMDSPGGLGISGSLLFICDKGLKIYDITQPTNPIYLKKLAIDAVDIIPIDTLLLVATGQGLAEYSIDENNELHFISSIYSNQ